MANITWTPPSGWKEENGAHVSFKAPCDCIDAGNLIINNHTYSIVDAMGTVVTGTGDTFVSGAVLDFVLDYDNKKAYLLNMVSSSHEITPTGVVIKIGSTVVAELTKTSDGRGVLTFRDVDHPTVDGFKAYATTSGGGGATVQNPDGKNVIVLSSGVSGMQSKAGGVVVNDASGNGRAYMAVDSSGNGVLELLDANGNSAGLTKDLIDQIINPTSVAIESGSTVVAELTKTSDGRGVLTLKDVDHPTVDGFKAYATTSGGGGATVQNPDGKNVIVLSSGVSGMQSKAGGVVVNDASGNGRAYMAVDSSGNGVLELLDANGNSAGLIIDSSSLKIKSADGNIDCVNLHRSTSGAGQLILQDDSYSFASASIYAGTDGVGRVKLCDANGNAAYLNKDKIDQITETVPISRGGTGATSGNLAAKGLFEAGGYRRLMMAASSLYYLGFDASVTTQGMFDGMPTNSLASFTRDSSSEIVVSDTPSSYMLIMAAKGWNNYRGAIGFAPWSHRAYLFTGTSSDGGGWNKIFCSNDLQRGTATLKYGPNHRTSAGIASVSVTFPNEFTSVPKVIVQQMFNTVNIVTDSITKTGFTMKISDSFTSDGSKSVDWVAIL